MAQTLYYSVIPASDPTPSADYVIAGLGLAHGSVADPGTGDYTFSPAIGGLTTGTKYALVYVLADGPLRSNVERSPTFVGTYFFAGAPTLSAATVFNITGTGATPRVTITF